MATVLPQELVAEIIYHLKQDIESLKRCALVSRSFAAPSQQHIFHRVRLMPPMPNKQKITPFGMTCERFFDLLNHSPYLAEFVKDLVIDIGDDTLRSATPWVSTLTSQLCQVLEMLRNLQSVYLRYAAFFSSLKWELLPLELRDTLISVLRNGITSFSLGGVTFASYREFSAMFDGCATLSHLSLMSVRIPEPVDDQPIIVRPKLQSLQRTNRARKAPNVSWLSSVDSTFDLSQLRHLSVDIATSRDVHSVWDILAQTKSTLKHLSLWFSYDREFVELELPDFSQLQTISFNMMIESLDQLCDLILWLNRLFGLLPEINCVEGVDIQVDCRFTQTPFSLDIPEWGLLDKALTQPALAHLRSVNIGFKATRDMWIPSQYATAFPGLRNLGILSNTTRDMRIRML